MPYIKNHEYWIDKIVELTEEKSSSNGKFTVGSVVMIVDEDAQRGFTFRDGFGNEVCKAGFTGFKKYTE